MSKKEEALLKGFRELPETQQQVLLDYTEFLSQRYAIDVEIVADSPLDIARPEKESVVKAVKRLSKTYPMLDTKILFEKTSSFMMRNLMHGEGSVSLIDEMEIFFEQQFHILNKEKVNGE